jgi:sialate O-acetylesterase
MKKRFLMFLVIGAGLSAQADVTLPDIFSDHMVLCRSKNVPIWGTAEAGDAVRVELGERSAEAKADASGKWKVVLNLSEIDGPGPFEVVVKGKNEIRIQDVLVGEVWVASGQSNMEWVAKKTTDADAEIARSANPQLRQFAVKKAASKEPKDVMEGQWTIAGPETTGSFTAVGYFFGKKLSGELKQPVGIINTSLSGTPSEAWTSIAALDTDPDLKAARERLTADLDQHPGKKRVFVEELRAWIKEHGREDRPTVDAAAFAGKGVSSEGWHPVELPGLVRGAGLPEAGIVWIRKEVLFDAKPDAKVSLYLPIDGFDAVYWNGELLKATGYEELAGTGAVRRGGPFDLAPEAVEEGKNVLAIRLYQPVGPAKISGPPRAGSIGLAGQWLAKAEREFAPVDAAVMAKAPQLPPQAPWAQNIPSFLFNGMVSPVIPYAIRGAIWYQGESNAGRAFRYRTAFPLLIDDWRKQWAQGDFPFYFCQLANFMAKKPQPEESAWAELREAQSMALKLPNTGQAVLIDIGEEADIHPRNKRDVGERLARIALAKDYSKKAPYSGPVYESMTVAGGKVSLSFKQVGGGLVAKPLPATYDVQTLAKKTAPLVRNSPNSDLEGFAICGEDKAWVWADAKIDGDNVIVWSEKVPAPVAVRYAWSDNPTCNLYNKADLPASPFRTDDFKPKTIDEKL